MTIWIYGDVALDNYEYEHPGGFPKAYKDGLGLTEDPYPGLSGRIRNRFVVRKFGGAHLLARFVAIALAVWNKGVPGDRKDLDANTTRKGLHRLRPWAEYRETLYRMQEDLAKYPTDFEDILNFFYRVSKDPDNAYRMQPGGYEGYTLPMQLQKKQALFRCLLGAGNGDTAPKKPVDRQSNSATLTTELPCAYSTMAVPDCSGKIPAGCSRNHGH